MAQYWMHISHGTPEPAERDAARVNDNTLGGRTSVRSGTNTSCGGEKEELETGVVAL